jgi:hypothetical protein
MSALLDAVERRDDICWGGYYPCPPNIEPTEGDKRGAAKKASSLVQGWGAVQVFRKGQEEPGPRMGSSSLWDAPKSLLNGGSEG